MDFAVMGMIVKLGDGEGCNDVRWDIRSIQVEVRVRVRRMMFGLETGVRKMIFGPETGVRR